MSNVKSIIKNKPSERMVSLLEGVLEDAKRGEILEVVIVGRMIAGDRMYAVSTEEKSAYEMLGMLEDAKQRYWADNNLGEWE